MWAVAETMFLGPGLIPALAPALVIFESMALAATTGSFPSFFAFVAAIFTKSFGDPTPGLTTVLCFESDSCVKDLVVAFGTDLDTVPLATLLAWC